MVGSILGSALGTLVEALIYSPDYPDRSTEEVVRDIAVSAANGIVTGMAGVYIEGVIDSMKSIKSITKTCMIYDDKTGEAISMLLNQIAGILWEQISVIK